MVDNSSRECPPAGAVGRSAADGSIAEAARPTKHASISPTISPPRDDVARRVRFLAVDELRTLKPLTVTVATARRISGLGNTTLWALIRDRRLQTVRIGRRTLINYRSLEILLEPDTRMDPKSRPSRRSPRIGKADDRAPGGR